MKWSLIKTRILQNTKHYVVNQDISLYATVALCIHVYRFGLQRQSNAFGGDKRRGVGAGASKHEEFFYIGTHLWVLFAVAHRRNATIASTDRSKS
jgi:hypothetical protein